MQRFIPVFLGLAITFLTGTLYSLAQASSDCPTSAAARQAFSGGYCRRAPDKKIAIVFVHGVLGDYKSTWTNPSSKIYWPALLASDPAFVEANIYVHQFVSPKLDTAQKVEELAVRLGDALDVDRVLDDHAKVVFVSHSMGGLMVRAFLLQRKLPSSKVPLIYFFGTPSAGANLANVAALVATNEQYRDMLPFKSGGYVEQLANRWLSTSQDPGTAYPRKIWSYCAYEKKGVLGKIIVEEFSAIFLCNVQPRAVLADHIEMVKPAGRKADPYIYFAAAYQFALSKAGKTISEVLEFNLANQPFTPLDFRAEGTETFRLKRESVERTYFDVGCEERKSGVLEVPLTLGPRERLLTARVLIEKFANLSNYSFVVEAVTEKSVRLKFDVEGLQRQFFNCPDGGNAHVLINYVVTRPAR